MVQVRNDLYDEKVNLVSKMRIEASMIKLGKEK